MFVEYSHPDLDLDGNWQSRSGDLNLWFSMVQMEPGAIIKNAHQREEIIMSAASRLVTAPRISLETANSHPVATASHDSLIDDSELYLEEPIQGIMLFRANHDNMGDRALEICAGLLVRAYGDLMLERVSAR